MPWFRIGYEPSKHADDWTQLFGLCCIGFAVLLDQAHRSANDVVRRVVARGVLAFTVPCVLLMAYWQVIPDRRAKLVSLVSFQGIGPAPHMPLASPSPLRDGRLSLDQENPIVQIAY